MILVAVTNAKKKVNFLITMILLALLLVVLVPSLYNMMVDASSMERFVSGEAMEQSAPGGEAADEEGYPGEPMRVNGSAAGAAKQSGGWWDTVAYIIFGK